MAFRDETEALRARIEALEGELGDARDQIAALEREREDASALRERVAELERELAKHRPRPRTPADDARRAQRIKVGLGVAAVVGVAAVGWVSLRELAGPDPDAPPERGVVTLDDAPMPPALSGEAHGDAAFESGCPGFASASPFVTLRAAEGRRARIWTESGADLVLYVRTADGRVVCDDDSGEGMNPSLVADLGPGDHAVWVGTYSQGASAPFSLRVDARRPAEARIDTDAPATLGDVHVTGVDRHVRDGRTVGDLPAANAQPGCAGHIPSAPQVDLVVDAPGTARIMARGREDLVMMVRRPDGTFVCDDDAGGDYDPLIIEPLRLGRYRVWVGTYGAGREGEFQLSVDVDAADRPDPNAPPRLGRWNLDGESLLSFSERVDGQTPVSSTHPECRTLYGSDTADLELALSEASNVTLSLTSDAFLGVLVEHPDGTQTCEMPLPTQVHTWEAGTHRVWVAAPEPGAGASFTLVVQTVAP